MIAKAVGWDCWRVAAEHSAVANHLRPCLFEGCNGGMLFRSGRREVYGRQRAHRGWTPDSNTTVLEMLDAGVWLIHLVRSSGKRCRQSFLERFHLGRRNLADEGCKGDNELVAKRARIPNLIHSTCSMPECRYSFGTLVRSALSPVAPPASHTLTP